MGVLATSFAAHFVNWVEKMDEIRGLFARFVNLYQTPEEALQRPLLATSVPIGSAPLAPKELPSDFPPKSPGGSASEMEGMEEEVVSPPHSTAQALGGVSTGLGARCQSMPPPGAHGGEDAPGTGPARPPWKPSYFSTSSRAMVREGMGSVGSNVSELLTAIKPPGVSAAGGTSSDSMSSVGNELEEAATPNICDFRMMQSQAASASSTSTPLLPERKADWAAAAWLLHYERLLWNASANGEVPSGANEAEAWGDPLRLDMRKTGQAVNRAIKAFTHVEHQRKRECQRRGINPPASRIPQQPANPDGDPDVPSVAPGAATADASATSMEALASGGPTSPPEVSSSTFSAAVPVEVAGTVAAA